MVPRSNGMSLWGRVSTMNEMLKLGRSVEELQVGVRIRHARILKGMRMRDLAEKVDCDESMISKIEAGKVLPSLMMLHKVVTALELDLASFFGLEFDEHKLVQTPDDRVKITSDVLRGG